MQILLRTWSGNWAWMYVLLNCQWYNKQFISHYGIRHTIVNYIGNFVTNVKYTKSSWARRSQWSACGMSSFNWIINFVLLWNWAYHFHWAIGYMHRHVLLQVSRYETWELECCNMQDLSSSFYNSSIEQNSCWACFLHRIGHSGFNIQHYLAETDNNQCTNSKPWF